MNKGISELLLYGDLVYRLKKTVEKENSDQFKNITKLYKKWDIACM